MKTLIFKLAILLLLTVFFACSSTQTSLSTGHKLELVQAKEKLPAVEKITLSAQPARLGIAGTKPVPRIETQPQIAKAKKELPAGRALSKSTRTPREAKSTTVESETKPEKNIEPWGLASIISMATTIVLSCIPAYLIIGPGIIAISSFTFLFGLSAAIVSLVRFSKHKDKYKGKALPWVSLGIAAAIVLFIIVLAIAIAAGL